MHKTTIMITLIMLLLGSCMTVSTTPDLIKSPVVSQIVPSAPPIPEISGLLTSSVPSPTPTQTIQLTLTASRTQRPSATQLQRTISSVMPTGVATAVSSIVWVPTPMPLSAVKQKCLLIEGALPSKATMNGTLILAKMYDQLEGEVDLVDLENNNKHLLLKKQDLSNLWRVNFAVSPNKKWFAYVEPTLSGENRKLRLVSADGQEQSVPINWDDSWGRIAGWSDNQWLTLWPFPKDIGEYDAMDRLNPFTGETQAFSSNFVNGINYNIKLIPLAYYNPTLTRSVYISGKYFFLEDVQEKNTLWGKENANLSVRPAWSPDGTEIVVVVATKGNFTSDFFQNDLFLVSQDGDENQLTFLADAYPSMSKIYIDLLEWSPDGRYIAFFLRMKDNTNELSDPRLFVVEVTTKQITDYCVTSAMNMPILWSSNSEQLVLRNSTDDVVLVDLKMQFAVQIADEMIPMGWIVSP